MKVLAGISNPTWFPHVIDAESKVNGSVVAQGSGDMNLP